MVKAEKKFRLSAILAIFVLLTVLLAVINIVSFTMASGDADEITQLIADRRGSLSRTSAASGEPSYEPAQSYAAPGSQRPGPFFRFDAMGPDSPELIESTRYFTVVFPAEGEPQLIAYQISAVTEEEAVSWAQGLRRESIGWTNDTYRYRVYEIDGAAYVTVIDQGRELLASYRILVISIVGELLCLIISFFVLKAVGRRVFSPIEKADEKQKKFIAGANREFRLPLTIISAETELLERAHGPDDRTRSIHRQVRKMDRVVEKLETLAIFDEPYTERSNVPLSELLTARLDQAAPRFAEKGLTLEQEIEPEVTLLSDPEAMKRMVDELIGNALRYARSKVLFRLWKENERVFLVTENDAELPDGACDQAFDRFTTLPNAEEGAAGLGLAGVRDVARAHDGRASARASDGMFTVRIAL